MSRVYFTDRTGEAELMGWERAHMGVTVDDFGFSLLNGTRHWPPLSFEQDVRTAMTPDTRAQWDRYGLRKDREALRVFLGSMGSSIGPKRELTDGTVTDEPWHVWLNTVHVGGSDPLKLFARIHAQCEIHCWMDGPDRAWVADIIDQGRRIGLYRADAGWEQVAAFLRERDDCEAIMSSSTTDGFPDVGLVKEMGLWEPGPDHQGVWAEKDYPDKPHLWGQPWWDGDEWYELDHDTKWDLSIVALRKQEEVPGGCVQITRESWKDYWHGNGLNAFKLNEAMARIAVKEREKVST